MNKEETSRSRVVRAIEEVLAPRLPYVRPELAGVSAFGIVKLSDLTSVDRLTKRLLATGPGI